jgi:hypothetical protein
MWYQTVAQYREPWKANAKKTVENVYMMSDFEI